MERNRRTLHFSAPGFRPQEVEVAPEPHAPPSKRAPLIENEEDELDTNLTTLDIDTKKRNRIFQERLNEIKTDCIGWHTKLQLEEQNAKDAINHQKEMYTNHLNHLETNILNELNSIFNRYDEEIIPPIHTKLNDLHDDLNNFFHDIVPKRIETNSGTVSRHLKRVIENFDIEQKKEEKRETKIILRGGKHIQRCGQRFEDEKAFRTSYFRLLEDDIISWERIAIRNAASKIAAATACIANLNQISLQEAKERQSEDVIVLDTVIETQSLLQQMILMHFGTRSDDLHFIEFHKLQRRLDKIQARRNSIQVDETQVSETDAKDQIPTELPTVPPAKKAGKKK